MSQRFAAMAAMAALGIDPLTLLGEDKTPSDYSDNRDKNGLAVATDADKEALERIRGKKKRG